MRARPRGERAPAARRPDRRRFRPGRHLGEAQGRDRYYGPAQQIRWYRAGNPFALDGFYDKGLRWASRFEIYITATREATIWVRVYPQYYGHHINLRRVPDPSGLMQQMLRFSYRSFFFWGLDDDLDAFAGYQFTLESGFPEEAVEEVIKSIPLIGESVGELTPFITP